MISSPAVVLAQIPDGVPAPTDFALREVELAEPAAGEVRIAVRTLSLDPYLRSTLGGRHLGSAVTGVGDVVGGRSIGTVVASRHPAVAVGATVLAETGWRAEAVVPGDGVTAVEVPEGVDPAAILGPLGMPGLTAYAAHRRQLLPTPGDTVLIGAATGGVGALAGQLARQAGARTVALVGSPEKAALATERLGYDVAVQRGPGLADALAAACPDRIDAYLHSGDQETLDVVMEQLAVGARVSLCGLMDQYNGGAPTRVRAGAIMMARAEVRGMVVYDHHDLIPDQQREVGAGLASGDLIALEDRYTGLDQAPLAFHRLMSGHNTGKVLVDLPPR